MIPDNYIQFDIVTFTILLLFTFFCLLHFCYTLLFLQKETTLKSLYLPCIRGFNLKYYTKYYLLRFTELLKQRQTLANIFPCNYLHYEKLFTLSVFSVEQFSRLG